jgi:hypothetical protein
MACDENANASGRKRHLYNSASNEKQDLEHKTASRTLFCIVDLDSNPRKGYLLSKFITLLPPVNPFKHQHRKNEETNNILQAN